MLDTTSVLIELCIGKGWLGTTLFILGLAGSHSWRFGTIRREACLGSGTCSVGGWSSGDCILTHLMMLSKQTLLNIIIFCDDDDDDEYYHHCFAKQQRNMEWAALTSYQLTR